MKRTMLFLLRGARAVALAVVIIFTAVWTWAETDLMDLRSRTGAILEWDPWSQKGILLKRGTTVAFRVGLSWAVIDYDQALDIGPVTRDGGSVRFTDEGAERIAAVLDQPRLDGVLQRVVAVMIDPGHGGRDPGAVREHELDGRRVVLLEKDIVLNIGMRLYEMLTQEFPDKQILMTRDEDVFVELEQRPEMANAAFPEDPDIMLFVSIHANSVAFRTKPSGFEVWVLPKEEERDVLSDDSTLIGDRDTKPIFNAMLDEQISRESVVLGSGILEGLDARVGNRSRNRGMLEESWSVVRHARMPAVLVEVGFLSNPVEARRLTQPAYLNDLAHGIYDGISGFIMWFESSPGLAQ